MFFVIRDRTGGESVNLPKPYVVLRKDNWNDYSYYTLFQAFVYMPDSDDPVPLGDVKIMRLGQKENEKTFAADIIKFESLSLLESDYCSLGVNLEYYKDLKSIGANIAVELLTALCDASYDESIKDRFYDDPCFNASLLRFSESKEALDKGGSLFGKKATREISFVAEIPLSEEKKHTLKFDFNPFKGLPHRVNLLVGSNGVGKTQTMAKLAILLSRFAQDENDKEKSSLKRLMDSGKVVPRPSLYNVVAVSFNAFDSFELPNIKQSKDFNYSYCGLRNSEGGFFSEDELAINISKLSNSMKSEKRELAIKHLSSLTGFEDFDDHEDIDYYKGLSAGQKIVTNILMHIVDKIAPQSLILLDEPETHLHPKLMTTLYMAILDILDEYDSFAVVATHSPIIVQQVPSRYVQILKRIDNKPVVQAPHIECFGENLSDISRNLFQTTESDRDYEQVIDRLLQENSNNPVSVEEIFDGQLGMNARIYLRSKARNS
ncbi:AAA family ATPase [Motiliproteus sp. SC1-56]|uniref:AAA family ATPase n=1 Tax=Motiliproteus sp. SC1-56 TaxID=2799565 RepID=UPI001A8CB1E3|nr:AAA family ATPase [Motiliproteus sp. SC1-56]